jgi:hypothetical protein
MARPGKARRGTNLRAARLGEAGPGWAGRGLARHGTNLRAARLGRAGLGGARRGLAGLGMARQGKVTTKNRRRENEMKNANIEYDNINKGDTMSQQECEKVLMMTRKDDRDRYDLALMNLARNIEQVLAAKGRPLFVRCESGGLRVMTDTEASNYKDRHFRNSLNRAIVCHAHAQQVDTSVMSQEEKDAHRAKITTQAAFVASIAYTQQQLALNAVPEPQKFLSVPA